MARESRRRDRAATCAALLGAARRRFAALGYDGVRVRDVAADVGVDPALVFRYFGSKPGLFREATGAGAAPSPTQPPLRSPADNAAAGEPATGEPAAGEPAAGEQGGLAARLLRTVVTDGGPSAGEQQLLALLRSPGHLGARERLQRQVCDGYVAAFAAEAVPADRELRAELVGALLLGIAVQRSVVGTPALSAATAEEIRPVFEAAVAALLGR